MDFILPALFGFICSTVFYLYINGSFEFLFLIIRGLFLLTKNFNKINNTLKEFSITPELLNQYISSFDNLEISTTVDLMNLMMNNKTSDTKPKPQTYISKTGKCMHIYYDFSGTQYMLTIPYDALSSVDMIQYQMDAIYENGDIVTITQQPGIPYLFSSRDIGFETLKATNHETDAYHEYKNETKPYFCREICDI